MRITSFKPLLLLAALAALVPTLSGCDTNVPQKIGWEPGDELAIVPTKGDNDEELPNDGFAPGVAYYYVAAHNRNWTYKWTVSPDIPSKTLQDGQFFRIQFDEPDTYTVTVSTTIEGQEYDDTLSVAIKAPTAARQVSRMPQFTTFSTLLARAGISIPDGDVTVLAPTNEAFVAAFDANGNGAVETTEIPAESILADIL